MDKIPMWVTLSVAKHFETVLTGQKIYLEGQSRDTSKDETRFEIRIDGPIKTIIQAQYEIWFFEINVLLVTYNNGQKHVGHVDELLGLLANGFTDHIPVYKFGPDQDLSFYGCLRLKIGFRERVVVSKFGNVNANTNMFQGTVEGHYELEVRR